MVTTDSRDSLPTQLTAAERHYQECLLCEHRCGARRHVGERGPCKAGTEARVFRHRVEYSEELELIPSHLFYLSGCDLRCAFCIAELNAFDPRRGRRLEPSFFNDAVAWGRERGARNVQWVGGEPTIHLPAILQVMDSCDELPPVVWKSDFHFTPEALRLMEGAVDVFVADFKFGNDACARRIAGVEHYLPILTRNLVLAASAGDLIIRHLLLPGHFECCVAPMVAWIREHLPQAKFSLRDGYLPRWQAHRHDELAKPVDRHHSERSRELVASAGLNLIE